MRTVTATELARNFRSMLDRVEFNREELVVIRNSHTVARIIPGPALMNAMEAMGDIYRTLSEEAADGWLDDAKVIDKGLDAEMRDPWDS